VAWRGIPDLQCDMSRNAAHVREPSGCLRVVESASDSRPRGVKAQSYGSMARRLPQLAQLDREAAGRELPPEGRSFSPVRAACNPLGMRPTFL
jgi:hypothetical protein